jgi:hypothetical protein
MSPYDHDHGEPPRRGAERPAAGPRCPICGNPAEPRHKPFCSRRCADIDLHRWLAGVYRVPTSEKPADEKDDE